MSRSIRKPMPRLVAELHAQFFPRDSVIRSFRMTPTEKNPHCFLANPPFTDSDTALPACAFARTDATTQVVSETKANMAGRCKVRVTSSELRISCFMKSTFEIQHSSFSTSSNQSGEREIRRALIKADLVDCMN